MQQVTERPPASDTAATPSTAENSVTHYEVRRWNRGPGDCGAECDCGTFVGGFSKVAEASAELAVHIADSTVTHPAWCSPEQCWAYPADEDQARPGGFHQGETITIGVLGGHGLMLRMVQDHGTDDAPEIELSPGGYSPELPQTLHLSLAQLDELRDAIDTLLSGCGRPVDDIVIEAFRAGRAVERQRVHSIVGGGERKAYACGYVDGLHDRLSKRGVR